MIKKITNLLILSSVLFLSACDKELSTENSDTSGNELIVGRDCRIAKMGYTDTATNINIGSIAATINILNRVEEINTFDSLAQALTFASTVTESNDTIYLNSH
jgi:type III secretory pathway lipoprotein EscJ